MEISGSGNTLTITGPFGKEYNANLPTGDVDPVITLPREVQSTTAGNVDHNADFVTVDSVNELPVQTGNGIWIETTSLDAVFLLSIKSGSVIGIEHGGVLSKHRITNDALSRSTGGHDWAYFTITPKTKHLSLIHI